MYFLGNSLRERFAAIFGLAAFVLPLLPPWPALICLMIAATVVSGFTGKSNQLYNLLIVTSVSVGVAGGVISAPIAIAALSATVLSAYSPLTAITILGLQTSYVASIEAILANFLFDWHLETASPALVAGMAMLFAQFSYKHLLASLLPVPFVWLAQQAGLYPEKQMLIAGIPVLMQGFLSVPTYPRILGPLSRIVIAIAVVIASIGWALTPPRMPEGTYILLLGSNASPEEKYYRNYPEVVRFSGIRASVVENPNDIPPNSLVLLPWLTSSEHREASPSLEKLRKLALQRSWTVVLVGEHTNMGGVATKVEALTGQQLLRDDLTVPVGNTDDSGHMQVGDLRPWFPEAIFNRGASIEIHGFLSRVLLSGDGWWSEPNIEEWLWVGDYLWSQNERSGRLVLAASVDDGNARWVVVGDSSLFLNSMLVSDPRPATHILELSSLWPLFLKDLSILLLIGLIIFKAPVLLLISMLGLALAGGLLMPIAHDGMWQLLWKKESAFDERNFNVTLAESPTLLSSSSRLVRSKKLLSGNIEPPKSPTVLFGLIDSTLTIGDTTLSQCRRLGSLEADGVTLMDAQACAVDGEAQVLVGDVNEAAILKVGSLLVVLDQGFLSQRAPIHNRLWLEKQVK